MGRAQRSVVAPDPHSLRLIQQVPPGTPGAYLDPVLGRSWSRSPKSGPNQGLNGRGGFVQAEHNPVLGDSSEMTVTLPPDGSDGKHNRDRLYFYAGTPDVQQPPGSPRAGYAPGDEWIEVYRGVNELVANGTPVSEQSDPSQMTVVCRDATQPLRKARETNAGFWQHAPRDVFENYTRAWQTLLADSFLDGSQFPTLSNSVLTSPNGRWKYQNCKPGPQCVQFTPAAAGQASSLETVLTIPEAGQKDLSCWRVETSIGAIVAANGGGFSNPPTIQIALGTPTTTPILLAIGPAAASVYVTYHESAVNTTTLWPCNAAGLKDASGHFQPPYTIAIEARERWLYFYLNAQLIATTPRPFANAVHAPYDYSPGALTVQVAAGPFNPGDYANVDYVVIRRTTPPMNGGIPGDYQLASPPAPGGLAGQYFDLTDQIAAMFAYGAGVFATPLRAPSAKRVDPGVNFTVLPNQQLGWTPAALGNANAVTVVWTGAIYLPLATQDVHFRLGNYNFWHTLWVGRTRSGEAICNGLDGPFYGAENAGPSSVGMRSLLGSVSGWYPIRYEFHWQTGGAFGTVGFTYDVGGAGTVPPPGALSPYGCMVGQIQGVSHYDALRTLSEQFVLQWKSEPRALESGAFPGIIVPRVRVGRDTDYVLDDTQAVSPQSVMTAEDIAQTITASAQGLGGNTSGSLTVEAFAFQAMGSHPFTSSEAETLPATSELSMLITHLASLLALRSNVWQEIQASSIGQRQMQDTFPLTGQLAEFDWGVGDGLRAILPAIGVVDATPRQIIQLKRLLYPDGMGENTASFRSRPRDFKQTMQRFIRQVYAEKRGFQGQLTYAPGSRAVAPAYSEAILPADLSLVRQAFLAVLSKSDTSTFTVEINGTLTGQTVVSSSLVDVSNFVARNNAIEPRMVCRLTGGTGIVSYQLALLTLIQAG